MGRIITVAASDFAYLYGECSRFWYEGVLGVSKRPRSPRPNIFAAIDGAMKRHVEGATWHQINKNGDRFQIIGQWKSIKSKPIPVPGAGVALVLAGVYDSLIAF